MRSWTRPQAFPSRRSFAAGDIPRSLDSGRTVPVLDQASEALGGGGHLVRHTDDVGSDQRDVIFDLVQQAGRLEAVGGAAEVHRVGSSSRGRRPSVRWELRRRTLIEPGGVALE